jgi:hypothetical protein
MAMGYPGIVLDEHGDEVNGFLFGKSGIDRRFGHHESSYRKMMGRKMMGRKMNYLQALSSGPVRWRTENPPSFCPPSFCKWPKR